MEQVMTEAEANEIIANQPGGRVEEAQLAAAVRARTLAWATRDAEKARARTEREAAELREVVKHVEVAVKALEKLTPEQQRVINAATAEMKDSFPGIQSGSISVGAITALGRLLQTKKIALLKREREIKAQA